MDSSNSPTIRALFEADTADIAPDRVLGGFARIPGGVVVRLVDRQLDSSTGSVRWLCVTASGSAFWQYDSWLLS